MQLMKKGCLFLLVSALLGTAAAQQPAADVNVPKLKTTPVVDGKLGDWQDFDSIKMTAPNVDDLKVESAAFGWNDRKLYFAVKVSDHKIINDNPVEKLDASDSVELRMLAADSNTLCKIVVAPASKAGKPAIYIFTRDLKTKQVNPIIATTENNGAQGIEWALTQDNESWSVEAGIPFQCSESTRRPQPVYLSS